MAAIFCPSRKFIFLISINKVTYGKGSLLYWTKGEGLIMMVRIILNFDIISLGCPGTR